jgi:hypothetical protein
MRMEHPSFNLSKLAKNGYPLASLHQVLQDANDEFRLFQANLIQFEWLCDDYKPGPILNVKAAPIEFSLASCLDF